MAGNSAFPMQYSAGVPLVSPDDYNRDLGLLGDNLEPESSPLRIATKGGRKEQINTTAKTANHTITNEEQNTVNDTSGGAFWNKLPASPEDGEIHTIILDTAGNTLTVDGNGKNINGSATMTMTVVSAFDFIYNGTQWNVK